MNTKKYSVHIQTDKSIYKPSDTVRFRVLILDADTRPFHFDTCMIYITDGAGNRIKQFQSAASHFRRGVYENQLQLSDQPVMGAWKIHVKINGDEEEQVKSFDVDEYVLPKFEANLEVNQDANVQDGLLKVRVNAKYTFGKAVTGTANISMKIQRWFQFDSNTRYQVVTVNKTAEVNKFVNFDVSDRYGSDVIRRNVRLLAIFKEQMSGKEVKLEKSVPVHEDPCRVELQSSVESFRPQLPFIIKATVLEHHKEVPIMDSVNRIKFKVTYFDDTLRNCNGSDFYDERKWNSGVGTKTVKVNCKEMRTEEEVKEVKLQNGQAEIELKTEGNETRMEIQVWKFKNNRWK